MKKCHSFHMKIGPNMIKAEVRFDKDEMYLVYHLATKYSDGCVPTFVHDIVMNQIKTEFAEELKKDTEPKKNV